MTTGYIVPERKLPSQWEGLGEGIMDFSFSHYIYYCLNKTLVRRLTTKKFLSILL
jgi:hypothetical protein